MVVFGDARLPEEAKQKLARYADFVPFATEGLVYDAVSGHPDIFLCRQGNHLVAAPNLPGKYFELLQKTGLGVTVGKSPVGNTYPETARYNAVVTEKYLIHNPKIADASIAETFPGRKRVAVRQGYVRCNLLPLREDVFVTSDRGIEKALRRESLEVLYFSPEGILLPGFSHGFLGGCLGISGNRLFVTGSLSRYPEGEKLRRLFDKLHYETIELYDGPLFDGGGLFFFD